jgi:hypothetical protein
LSSKTLPAAPGAALAGLAALAALLPLDAAAQPAPAPGRYGGDLCVATGDATPDCGPVLVTLRPRGRLVARVGDIEYRLQLHSSQLDLVLMQGTMQIDGFTANYAWQGRALEFSDPDKPVQYRLRVGAAAKP